MHFTSTHMELIYQDLSSRYSKATLNKRELASELGISVSTVDLNISKASGLPRYKKLGNAKNSRVVFPIINVAEYLANTIEVM